MAVVAQVLARLRREPLEDCALARGVEQLCRDHTASLAGTRHPSGVRCEYIEKARGLITIRITSLLLTAAAKSTPSPAG